MIDRKTKRMVVFEKGKCLVQKCPHRGTDDCLERETRLIEKMKS